MRVSWSYLLPTPISLLSPPISSALFPTRLSSLKPYKMCVTQSFIRVAYRIMDSFSAVTLLQRACFPINREHHINPPRGVGSCELCSFHDITAAQECTSPHAWKSVPYALASPFPEALKYIPFTLCLVPWPLKVWCRCSIYSWTFN